MSSKNRFFSEDMGMKSFKKINENKKSHVSYFFSWKHVLVKSGEIW